MLGLGSGPVGGPLLELPLGADVQGQQPRPGVYQLLPEGGVEAESLRGLDHVREQVPDEGQVLVEAWLTAARRPSGRTNLCSGEVEGAVIRLAVAVVDQPVQAERAAPFMRG